MRFFMFLLLIPAWLGAFDTLYVVRMKPPDRTVIDVFPPGFVLTGTDSERKVNIAFRMFTTKNKIEKLDSNTGKIRLVTSEVKTAGKPDTMALRIRLWGIDTSKIEIRYTTEDTLPSNFRSGDWILTADGKFKKNVPK